MSNKISDEPVRVQVLRLRGELTLEDCLKIKKLIDEYLKAGLVHVALVMKDVSHIHLSGLPVLSERARRLREYGGDLKLAGLSTYLMHILELAGAKNNFDCLQTELEALEKFQNAPAR